MIDYNYVGSELELFSAATQWKSYLRRRIEPYLGREVLEVGAGLGGTTKQFCRSDQPRWVCLEPDAALATQLEKAIHAGELPASCTVAVGTLDQMMDLPPFDSVIYIDVLEHIEDDRGEMERVGRYLKPGGYVIALSPAHQWLYTPFDKAIGHYRRYTKKTLKALTPGDLDLVRLDYLDTVGLLASLGNRLVLRSAMPNPRQIAIWDKYMVRLSTIVDPILGHRLGKSVLGVWRKP